MQILFWCFMALVLLPALVGCSGKRQAVRPPVSSPRQEQHEQPGIDAGVASDIVGEARRWLGTPYKYGGDRRGHGTDCSGMVMVIFRDKAGVSLPRNSARQQQACEKIRREQLAPGDLVFFRPSTRGGGVSHVGIYVGGGDFIHASSSKGVMVSNLSQKYYDTHFHSAGRVKGIALARQKRDRRQEIDVVTVPVQAVQEHPGNTVSIPRLPAPRIPADVPAVTLDSLLRMHPAPADRVVPAIRHEVEEADEQRRRAQCELDSIIMYLEM